MSIESRPIEGRLPDVPLRGWPFLSTLGALPILAPIWFFNGLLSVEGLPSLWALLMGRTPDLMSVLFFYIGWVTVLMSTLVEIRVIYRSLKRRPIRGALLGSSFFFGGYDLLTTGLGLFLRLEPRDTINWIIWGAGTVFITYLVEGVLSMIWKDSRL